MKYLITAVLAIATFTAVACQSSEKSYEVADSQTVTIDVTGMT